MGVLALTLASMLAPQSPPPAPLPLFASDQPLRLRIQGPISAMSGRSDEARDGTLTVQGAAGETLPIRLSPRGLTRRKRDICQFPPLRVDFGQRQSGASAFAGQKRLKLVTHCRNNAAFQQHLLLEYAAYKLYNALSPASYRVRLANIDYVQPDGQPMVSRLGFFIEDLDDVAARNGGTAPPVAARVRVSQLSPSDAARVALFQYLIGNLDWSMHAGPEGDECCHNGRLITSPSAPNRLVPVPYDFDYSGLVDAPYAVPPEGIDVGSVRARRYRGYCVHNPQALAYARELRGKRGALQAVLAGIPQLEPGKRKRAAAYLDEFFDDIANDASVTRKLLRSCAK